MKTPSLIWLAVLLALPSPCGAVAAKITIRSISATNFPAAMSFGQSIVGALNAGTFASPKTRGLVAALKQVDAGNPQSLSAVDPVAYRLTMMAKRNPELFPGVGADVVIEVDGTFGASLGLALARMSPGQRDKLLAEALEAAAEEMQGMTGKLGQEVDDFAKKHPDDAAAAKVVTREEHESLKAAKADLFKVSTLFAMYLKDDAARKAAETAYKTASAKLHAFESLNVDDRLQAEEKQLAADRQSLERVMGLAETSAMDEFLARTPGKKLVKNLGKNVSRDQAFAIENLTPDLLGEDVAKALKALATLESMVKDIERDEQKMLLIDRFVRVVQKTPDEGRRERALAQVEKLSTESGSLEVADFVRKRLASEISALNTRKTRRDLAAAGIERENQRALEVSSYLDQRIARLETALSRVEQAKAKLTPRIPAPEARRRSLFSAMEQGAIVTLPLWVGFTVSHFLWGEHPVLTALAALSGLGFAAFLLGAARFEPAGVHRTGQVMRRQLAAYGVGLISLSLVAPLLLTSAVGALVAVVMSVSGLVVLVRAYSRP